MKKRNKKKKLTPTLVAAISALLIMIGGYLVSYNYVQSKKVYAYDYVSTEFFAEKDEDGTPVVVKKKKEEEKPEVIQEDEPVITNENRNYVSEVEEVKEDETSNYTLNDYRLFNQMLMDIKKHNQNNTVTIDKKLEYRLITKYSFETYDMFKKMLKIYSH
jgi:hypothetical protein